MKKRKKVNEIVYVKVSKITGQVYCSTTAFHRDDTQAKAEKCLVGHLITAKCRLVEIPKKKRSRKP